MLPDSLKVLFHYVLPKKALTVCCGAFANVKWPWFKNTLIRRFIRHFNVNMSEALIEAPEDYKTFNEFFIRPLKPHLREISQAAVVSPVDGVISEIGEIDEGLILQAKGRQYSVAELLGLKEGTLSCFDGGLFATLYLSPKDYHRVHMPIDATIKSATYLPGQLFSVQPLTVENIPRVFARNERCVVYFDTPIGQMAMVLVGATIVGKIGLSLTGDLPRLRTPSEMKFDALPQIQKNFKKGQEMGYFKLGSTVILLFAGQNRLAFDASLKAGMPICLGQALGDMQDA